MTIEDAGILEQARKLVRDNPIIAALEEWQKARELVDKVLGFLLHLS